MSGSFVRADDLVDRWFETFIEELCDCVRIPSVSAHGDSGLQQMAEWVATHLDGLEFTVRLVEVPGHAPVVLGNRDGKLSRRLLLYSHYDVQPAEPMEDWTYPPFDATAKDGVVFGRGVCDDKADIASRLQALKVWLEANGELPFEVVWLCEGGEEIGSPGLTSVCSDYADVLRADGCLWESFLRRADGTPEVAFGCKGLLYLGLFLRGLPADQHSSFAGIFQSAPVRLVQAIASMVGPDGRPAIEGLAASVPRPARGQFDELRMLELPDCGEAEVFGRSVYQEGDTEELLERLYFEPSINVSGLSAGYQGGGSKTVLPATASAKLDLRLLPGQSPTAVLALVEKHLRTRGFGDVELEVLSAVDGARSEASSLIGRAVLQASKDVLGAPVVCPVVPGSGPMHAVAEGLGVPTVTGPGSLRMDSGMHAADEHIRLTDYRDEIRFLLRLFELYGDETMELASDA